MTCARRLIAATATMLLACLALSGCAQTVAGQPSSPNAELATRLQQAMDAATSAHIEMQMRGAGLAVTASGDEKLDHTRATAFALTENIVGAGTIKVIDVGGVLYARLPAAMNPGDKPWVRVARGSTNPTIAALAQALQQIQDSASLRQYALLAHAATGIQDTGRATLHGTASERYTFRVLIGRLPQSLPGIAALRASGLTSVPVQLWVDGRSRVVRMVEAVTVNGRQISTQVDLSDYDEPVTITAPPADQIATH